MGWLTNRIGTAHKDVGAGAFLSMLFGGGASEDALYPEPSFTSHAASGFARNELVYACIMEKATSLPDAPLRVYAGDGMGDPREAHPLRVLIANPNPMLTEFELFELTCIHMDLAGIAFWEMVRSRAGQVVELWPLRPDLVRIHPQRDGRTRYSYVIGGSRAVPLGTDVLAFRYPNPVDPNVGQPPLRPALRAVALDNEATDFVKALLQNRAVPGTVIETEQKIDEALTNRLTDKWIQNFGSNRRGRPAFLQKGMKVHSLGLNLSDLEFPDLRTISETRICAALGVPPILVGAKAGLDRSTFANYREARQSFWEETLMPLQKRFQQVIVKRLLPELEGPRPRRSVVRFDNSEVLALRESEGKRWELATQALRAGGITVNQFCRYVGLPTNPDGDVYLRPAGVIPTDASGRPLVDLQSTTAQTSTGDPADDNAAGNDTGGDADSELGRSEPAAARQVLDLAHKQQAMPDTTRHKAVSDGQRRRYAAAIADLVERQRRVTLDDLQVAKTSRFQLGKAWDRNHWNAELTAVLSTHMRRFARAAARRVDRDADTAVMDHYIDTAASKIADAWNTATRDQVTSAARRQDWQTAVNEVFDLAAGVRATTLAGSTATHMHGFGAVDTATRVGHTHKTWTVLSGNPRSAHAALDGETVPIGEDFSNGARWPGDPILPAEERANCHCDVIFPS